MKFFMFHVIKEEEEALKRWSDRHHIDIGISRDVLSIRTVNQVKGCNGLCIQQTVPVGGPAVYQKLKQYGIRQIATRSAGYDMIDLREADRNGLTVTNVPAYSPYAVAELAVTQTLSLVRRIPQFDERIARHDFRWNGLISREIRSMTVGIIGTGHIGAIAARLFKGLGAHVIAFDQYPNEKLADILDYRASMEDVLRESDIVSLHTPLFDSTAHMINKNTLKLMKSSAFLINMARGGLVNTDDLIEALENREIAGAALDTFEDERFINQDLSHETIDNPQLLKLIHLDQVILTPHVGFFTTTAVQNMVEGGLNSVLDILTTGTSKNQVQPPSKEK